MITKNKTRFCFVIAGLGFGGAERVLTALANYLSRKGYEVSIITISSFHEEPAYKIDSKIKIINLNSNLRERNAIKRKLLHCIALRKQIKEINPNIVISFLTEVNYTTIISLIGTKIPIIISERNNPQTNPPEKIKQILRKLVYPLSDGFVFQTHEVKEYFSKKIQKKSEVIANPINIDVKNIKLSEERQKRIVSVGRLEEQKNFPLLIEAFCKVYKEHSDYTLSIYGSGSLEDYLNDYILKKGMKDIIVLEGTKKEIQNYIKNASVFVLSSEYEGIPNALAEAMALGIPCVATDCLGGGARELIDTEKNGILVSRGNIDEMANAIKRLIDDENLAKNISIEARKINKYLDIEHIGYKWEMYIMKILKLL